MTSIKDPKKKNWPYLFFLLVFIVLIILPIIVVGIGNQLSGYRINRNTNQYQVKGLSAIRTGIDTVCVSNSDTSRDFFIPTRSLNEWNKFQSNKPSVLTVHSSCCGDLACNGSENCTSCPGDCGACPNCYFNSDCGVPNPEWGGPWTCAVNTIRGYRISYRCTTGNCVLNYTLANYSICGGRENSRCRSSYSTCYNYCFDGTDNDSDSYIDAKDTDCGGCGNLECSSGSYCNTTTNCFSNGSSCGTGRVSVSNTCQCLNGGTFYSTSGGGGSCGSPCYYRDVPGKYVIVAPFGYNCSNGTNVTLQNCPNGSYNPPGGGASCRACGAGTHTNGMTGANSCSQCTAGYYCPRGVQIPCPSGSTSYAGARDIGGCFTGGTP